MMQDSASNECEQPPNVQIQIVLEEQDGSAPPIELASNSNELLPPNQDIYQSNRSLNHSASRTSLVDQVDPNMVLQPPAESPQLSQRSLAHSASRQSLIEEHPPQPQQSQIQSSVRLRRVSSGHDTHDFTNANQTPIQEGSIKSETELCHQIKNNISQAQMKLSGQSLQQFDSKPLKTEATLLNNLQGVSEQPSDHKSQLTTLTLVHKPEKGKILQESICLSQGTQMQIQETPLILQNSKSLLNQSIQTPVTSCHKNNNQQQKEQQSDASLYTQQDFQDDTKSSVQHTCKTVFSKAEINLANQSQQIEIKQSHQSIQQSSVIQHGGETVQESVPVLPTPPESFQSEAQVTNSGSSRFEKDDGIAGNESDDKFESGLVVQKEDSNVSNSRKESEIMREEEQDQLVQTIMQENEVRKSIRDSTMKQEPVYEPRPAKRIRMSTEEAEIVNSQIKLFDEYYLQQAEHQPDETPFDDSVLPGSHHDPNLPQIIMKQEQLIAPHQSLSSKLTQSLNQDDEPTQKQPQSPYHQSQYQEYVDHVKKTQIVVSKKHTTPLKATEQLSSNEGLGEGPFIGKQMVYPLSPSDKHQTAQQQYATYPQNYDTDSEMILPPDEMFSPRHNNQCEDKQPLKPAYKQFSEVVPQQYQKGCSEFDVPEKYQANLKLKTQFSEQKQQAQRAPTILQPLNFHHVQRNKQFLPPPMNVDLAKTFVMRGEEFLIDSKVKVHSNRRHYTISELEDSQRSDRQKYGSPPSGAKRLIKLKVISRQRKGSYSRHTPNSSSPTRHTTTRRFTDQTPLGSSHRGDRAYLNTSHQQRHYNLMSPTSRHRAQRGTPQLPPNPLLPPRPTLLNSFLSPRGIRQPVVDPQSRDRSLDQDFSLQQQGRDSIFKQIRYNRQLFMKQEAVHIQQHQMNQQQTYTPTVDTDDFLYEKPDQYLAASAVVSTPQTSSIYSDQDRGQTGNPYAFHQQHLGPAHLGFQPPAFHMSDLHQLPRI